MTYVIFSFDTEDPVHPEGADAIARLAKTLSEAGEAWAEADFKDLYENRDENFGNAREVRNLFEKAVARQADRVALLEAPTREQLMELRPEDLNEPGETPEN